MSESESQPGIDLDALDAPGGMDAVLAEYRKAPQGRASRTRPAWISMVAMALGVGLMAMMAGDFRYWLESEPRDPGALGPALTSGALADLDNRYTSLAGTPDVTHMVPIRRESGLRFGFMRLLEGDDQVFVFAARRPDQAATEFDGRYTGRLQRAEDLDSYDFLRQAFALEDVRDRYELAPADLRAWLEQPAQALAATDEREQSVGVKVEGNDRINLVFRPEQLVVQLGRKNFSSRAKAEAAVATLGRPFRWLPPSRTQHDDPDAELPNHRPFHTFLVAGSEADAASIEASLNQGIDVGDGTDPSRGVVALPRILSYTVAPDQLALEGEEIVFEYGENTADHGDAVRGDALVERELDGPALRLPFADLNLARLERGVRLSPDAMVLVADETPSKSRNTGLLFLLVGAIVGLNGAAMVAARRKRKA